MDRTRWDLIALVFLGGLLAAAQFGKVSLLLRQVAETYGTDLTRVSPLVSLVGLMGLILGAMAGGIAAAFGPGRTFLFGLVLGGVCSLAQAALPPFAILAVSRAVEGIAHLALVVGGPPLMAAAASDRHRPLTMGLWAVFFGASLAISGWLFPLVLAKGGLGLVWGLHGGALLLLAAVLWRRVPRIPATRPELNLWTTHRRIYAALPTVAPALGFVFYTFLFVALVALLPVALGRPGLAVVLPAVTLATTLLGGAACRWLPPHRVVAAGYAGTLAGLALEVAGGTGGVILAFAAMGLVPGASFAAIPALNPDPGGRARATGAIAQMGNLGTVTGTPALAAIWAAGGTGALLGAAMVSAACGLVVASLVGGRAARSGEGVGGMVDVP